MTNEKFMEFAKDKFGKQLQILGKKGAEYSKGKDDRFLNFKMAAAIQGISTREALLGQMAKHMASIIDMVKCPANYDQLDVWAEKIGDNINYLVLLEALIREEAEEAEETKEKRTKNMKDYDGNLISITRTY